MPHLDKLYLQVLAVPLIIYDVHCLPVSDMIYIVLHFVYMIENILEEHRAMIFNSG